MRRKYTMTEEQFKRILDASQPVPYMVFGGMEPRSPRENAMSAWASLGADLGFQYMTVEPVDGDKFSFTAEPLAGGGDE